MDKKEKLETYFAKDKPFMDQLRRLREIISATELEEDFKWNAPIYTINGKNVVGLGVFKHHYGVWFFNGALLKDAAGALHNAQEGKTRALRQLRYDKEHDIDEKLLGAYLAEAITNQKMGREIKPVKPIKKVTQLPGELSRAMDAQEDLKQAFNNLTPGRQKEYAEHIAGAKQEATRQRRLEKAIPLILAGQGLHDKYKNC